jgi:hypothetical protein
MGGPSQGGRTAVTHYAGLDVSVKETAVCIVDGMGKVVRERKVALEPAEIIAKLAAAATTSKRSTSPTHGMHD